MRIAVTAVGSEGDLRPFIALTRRLCQAGHDAFLVASRLFAERVAEAQIPHRPVGRSVPEDKAALNAEIQAMFAPVMREKSPLGQASKMFDLLAVDLIAALPDVIEATRDADLIVHHYVDLAGLAAAVVHQKPRMAGSLYHGMLASSATLMNGLDLGRLGNLLGSSLIRFLAGRVTDPSFNRIFAAAGLPRRRGLLRWSSEAPLGNLLAVSPSLVPTDPRWEAQRVIQTGYWFLDRSEFTPPSDLAAFMAAGEPPLVITFGSMAGVDAKSQTASIVEAVRRTGRRAVLQAGWNQLGEGALPPSILRAQYVPHDWLFPRAACVVHHGGAGTTAAVLRAGVPHVVVHHLGDQVHWGNLLARRGLAAPPISHRKLNADRLSAALHAVLGSDGMSERARAMGERVRAEDGLGAAVQAIEVAGRRI
jgi:sterol 3beta-glucosyltransferase